MEIKYLVFAVLTLITLVLIFVGGVRTFMLSTERALYGDARGMAAPSYTWLKPFVSCSQYGYENVMYNFTDEGDTDVEDALNCGFPITAESLVVKSITT